MCVSFICYIIAFHTIDDSLFFFALTRAQNNVVCVCVVLLCQVSPCSLFFTTKTIEQMKKCECLFIDVICLLKDIMYLLLDVVQSI
jgi:hypothetical protein